MNDIFNDMDKVIAKFSDDMREIFKNYHREEVKKEVFQDGNVALELIKKNN